MSRLAFSDKIALITGGGRGQGLREAEILASRGATVLIGELDATAGRRAESLVPGARFLELDVASEASWAEAVRTITADFGRIDILVNNAAVLSYGGIAETPLSEVHRLRSVNLDGPYLAMQKTLPLFDEGGGSIINIVSIAGLMGRAGQVAYLMSKWGLRGLSRAAALEFSDRHIRVNAIFPGLIATAMSQGRYGIDGVETMGRALPTGRAGTPDDIASLVLFLASDDSSFITGAEFVCDGGATAGMG